MITTDKGLRIDKSIFIVKIIFDLLSLISVFSVFGYLIIHVKEPFKRGFYCDDESIRYPFKYDTITPIVCGAWSAAIALFSIIFCEIVHYLKSLFKSHKSSESLKVLKCCVVPSLIVFLYIYIGVYFFGAAVAMSMIEIGKLLIGRLRPNFIDVCKPDPDSYKCSNTNERDETIFLYVQDFRCTTIDEKLLLDSRKSFPSGHACLSVYTAIYVVLYLHVRFAWHSCVLLRHSVQACYIFLAFYVCLTRLSDNKHHWSDILAGAFIGFFIAALSAIYIANLCIPNNSRIAIQASNGHLYYFDV